MTNLPSAAEVNGGVSFREALWVWCRVAALSFGGPTAQIAVMHRILVEEKKWVSEHRFLHALNYCMLIPGPEAQQLATYIGWLLHGTGGGLAAGTLFVLPGFLSILALSVLYVQYHDTTLLAGLFFGLKPAVAAVVVEAVIRIGKRVLKNWVMAAIAVAAFIAIFFFQAPFPAIIISAGMIGLVGGRVWPEKFYVIKGQGGSSPSEREPERIVDAAARTNRDTPSSTILTAAFWLTLWFVPVALLWLAFGSSSVFVDEAVFFSKAAVVTFGGAYAVLPYVSRTAIQRHWLRLPEMLDGLGMAETTPGPLIMVVQFVGFMGAYRNPGQQFAQAPLLAGLLGSVVTVWVTFIPCFLWIFVGAPYIERLRGNKALHSALSAITAAVVGVVLNLAIWFGMRTLFPDTPQDRIPGAGASGAAMSAAAEADMQNLLQLAPRLGNFSWGGLVIAVVAALLLFYFHRGLFTTLGAAAALGIIFYLCGLR